MNAVVNRARQLGLKVYSGEAGEIYLRLAARLSGVPYYTLHQAATAKELPTVRRGKRRYVSRRALAAWLLRYRARQEAQGEALESLEGTKIITKQEAMKWTGLSETHIARYLQSGVIEAWKIPEGRQGRGFWLVNEASVQAFIAARNEGRLKELLDSNPRY
ncbi:MAG: hypothetical protein ACE5G8_17575, partial [Anaerolineae bacterium]